MPVKLRVRNILLILLFFISGCVAVYDTLSTRNLSGIYNPGDQRLHPEYISYVANASDVRLYFRFFPEEFLYQYNEYDSVSRANVSLFFRVTEGVNSTEIIDSLTTFFSLKGRPRKQFLGFVPLGINPEKKYIIEVFLSDKNANYTVSNIVEYTPNKDNAQGNFLLLSKYGTPLFKRFVTVNDTFRIRSDRFYASKLEMRYFAFTDYIPPPTDEVYREAFFPETPDSSWIIHRLDTQLFSLKKPGLYQIKDVESNASVWIPAFHTFYPNMVSAPEMLRPLNYLMTEKEQKKLRYYSTPKIAVDSFWIEAGRDIEASRELIRVYYNRVRLANYYFHDYREGWRTDRGMLFILLGQPREIRISNDGELWVYGGGSENGTQYFFTRTQIKGYGEVLLLEGSELYGRMYFNAVSSWRDGRVYAIQ